MQADEGSDAGKVELRYGPAINDDCCFSLSLYRKEGEKLV